jgi:RNA polymerase sigma-70 factor (ECF subfamily)
MDGQSHLADDLEAVATGDEAALRRLWDRAGPTLFGLCLKMLRRRDLAEDVLQDVFLRIWQKARSYDRAHGDPLAWMIVVARHAALDRLRQGRREEDRLEPLSELDAAAWVEFDDAADAEVGRCLELLDANARTALLLAYWGGLTHTELARALGVPLGTVKSWIRRALAELRDHLES